MEWVKRVEYPMNCNWKVFVDNYLDGGYVVDCPIRSSRIIVSANQ